MKQFYLISALFITIAAQAQFGYYFGNIHSQTSYSDGNKDSATSLITKPIQAFTYAKASQQIDFYGISDHNHLSAGMTNPAHFHSGIADANTANQDGSFVAMYGQEWGVISGGGHVIVYGIDSLMGWDAGDYDIYVPQSNYATLWSKINARPGAFAYLAHPQATDYTNLFTTAINASADNAIIGMAARSGPAFSTNNSYSNPSTSDFVPRYQEALSLGYHLGIGLDHDTHNSVFGRQTAGRLVALAPILTRNNILDAFRKMRIYSSDDWNVQVDFKINTQPMGSIYAHAGTPTISVNIMDPDAESTSSISVYYGVPGSGVLPTVLTTAIGTNSLTYNHVISSGSTYYYYLEITQTDGDVIWTSPIWYTMNNAITANPPVTAFSISAANHCVGQPISLIDNSTNTPTSWSWNMIGATTQTSTLQNPTVTYTAAGIYTVAMISSNGIGTGIPVTHTLMVSASPTLAVSSASICSGNTANLSVSGATTYSWSTGATTASISVSPTVNTTYTVTGTSGACFSQKTVTVTVTPGPIVSVNSATICYGNSTSLIASGATTYSWSTGATTTSITVSPLANTVYTVTGTSGGTCSSIKTATITVNPSPTVSVNNATVCSGTPANLIANGATSYSWSTGATTASVIVSPTMYTVYSVTGTTTGCTNTKTVSVTVNALPSVNATASSTNLCAGQSSTLTGSGAVSYTWNPGALTGNSVIITPTSNISYTCVGTGSNGCSGSSPNVNITVNALPAVTCNSASICNGSGSATLTATGASTYTWNTSATTAAIVVNPTVTTNYTVSGTSAAGCTKSFVTIVNVAATPTVTVNSATICVGNPANLTANGASTYSWSTGATTSSISVSPVVTTIYSLTGTSLSCSKTVTCTVNVNPNPTVTAVSNSSMICIGQTAILTANGASTYTWNTSSTTNSIVISPSVTTNYTVTGASTSSCSNSFVVTQSVSACTNINQLNNNSTEIKVYPNPFNSKITVITNTQKGRVIIYNILGLIIYDEMIEGEKIEIDLRDQASGIYFIQINSVTKKIIKE